MQKTDLLCAWSEIESGLIPFHSKYKKVYFSYVLSNIKMEYLYNLNKVSPMKAKTVYCTILLGEGKREK